MPNFICRTCGTQFGETGRPPVECKVCTDERQYVWWSGQQWTTLDGLRQSHRNVVRLEEFGLYGIGMEPSFGQRALLVTHPVVDFLIESCDLNVTDADASGQTPLYAAAFDGRIDAIKALIRQGSDVNIRNHIGSTPSHAAAPCGQFEALKLLMEQGADITVVDEHFILRILTSCLRFTGPHIEVMRELSSCCLMPGPSPRGERINIKRLIMRP